MKLRFAFVGFRHPHILSLWKGVKNHSSCEIVAACEEDAGTRKALAEIGQVTITHKSFDHMLSEVACDVVAIGDIYARRGSRCIRALEAGHHILSDKPICTEKRELERIRTLALEKGLSVGCQLDLVEFPAMRRLRDIISAKSLNDGGKTTTLADPMAPGRICLRQSSLQEPEVTTKTDYFPYETNTRFGLLFGSTSSASTLTFQPGTFLKVTPAPSNRKWPNYPVRHKYGSRRINFR